MSDPHASHQAHGQSDPGHADHGHDGHEGHISDKTFIKVFGALLICTAVSFATNQIFGAGSPAANFAIIAMVAIVKALLVVTFFMHLKIDWRKLFVFIVPAMILAPLIIIVLWPDLVLAWRTAPLP